MESSKAERRYNVECARGETILSKILREKLLNGRKRERVSPLDREQIEQR